MYDFARGIAADPFFWVASPATQTLSYGKLVVHCATRPAMAKFPIAQVNDRPPLFLSDPQAYLDRNSVKRIWVRQRALGVHIRAIIHFSLAPTSTERPTFTTVGQFRPHVMGFRPFMPELDQTRPNWAPNRIHSGQFRRTWIGTGESRGNAHQARPNFDRTRPIVWLCPGGSSSVSL